MLLVFFLDTAACPTRATGWVSSDWCATSRGWRTSVMPLHSLVLLAAPNFERLLPVNILGNCWYVSLGYVWLWFHIGFIHQCSFFVNIRFSAVLLPFLVAASSRAGSKLVFGHFQGFQGVSLRNVFVRVHRRSGRIQLRLVFTCSITLQLVGGAFNL